MIVGGTVFRDLGTYNVVVCEHDVVGIKGG